MNRRPPLPLALLLALSATLPAQAQSLSELYESARAFDAAYLAAKAQNDATLAKSDQAKAALLPTANLSSGASWTRLDSSLAPVARNFGTQSATVSASHPLYRPANNATYAQGMKLLDQAQAQLQAAEQDLVVRVSQAYFDVLTSQDSLTFVKAQKAAVAEQLASAKRNFEVGTSTITDTREAQARYDLVIAQEIAAENDLQVKKAALDQLVGRPGVQPHRLKTPIQLPALQAQEMDNWVQKAEAEHPAVRLAQTALDVAKLETEKAQAGNRPTVDLTASQNFTRNQNGSATSTATSRSGVTTVGVALNLPLFAGYSIQNRIRETLALEDKSRADLDAARRTVSLATRTAFLGVLSGLGQIKALEAAESSSQSALDANKLGYQVGVRINIDVLNSQSQLYQTKRDLAKARHDVLVANLRLRQANGSLKAEDLHAINSLLTP